MGEFSSTLCYDGKLRSGNPAEALYKCEQGLVSLEIPGESDFYCRGAGAEDPNTSIIVAKYAAGAFRYLVSCGVKTRHIAFLSPYKPTETMFRLVKEATGVEVEYATAEKYQGSER